MLKNNNLIIGLLLVLSFGKGQTVISQNYKDLSDIKWTGKNTSIRELIDNDGYYTNVKSYKSFIFYDDGTLVTCRAPSDTLDRYEMPWPPRAHFHRNCWRGGDIGVYRIEGDTIYANTYFCDYLLFIPVYGDMCTLRFHKIDRQTIIWDSVISRDWNGNTISLEANKNDTLYFEKDERLPPPNTKWKRKRWLWENKEDRRKLKK
ncbi:MAG: hypothetical protein K6A67_11415 [Bacteroidales bacterium]|nr:hypothetical protein [Bacteroidales bacterium]